LTSRSEPVVPPPSTGTRRAHARPDTKDEIGFALPEPAKVSSTRLTLLLVVVVGVLATLFVVGYVPRMRARTALSQATAAEHAASPRVEVVTPKARAHIPSRFREPRRRSRRRSSIREPTAT